MKRERAPPALAVLILSRCLRRRGRDAPLAREALIGDLAEEYGRGRSRAWYWRQTFWAVLADRLDRPLSLTGLRVLRLLVIGCLFVGASFDWQWPLFIFALDPVVWFMAHRRKHDHPRIRAR